MSLESINAGFPSGTLLPFFFGGVSFLKPNIVKKGTLIIKGGYWGTWNDTYFEPFGVLGHVFREASKARRVPSGRSEPDRALYLGSFFRMTPPPSHQNNMEYKVV